MLKQKSLENLSFFFKRGFLNRKGVERMKLREFLCVSIFLG